jgi:hypothetical protein
MRKLPTVAPTSGSGGKAPVSPRDGAPSVAAPERLGAARVAPAASGAGRTGPQASAGPWTWPQAGQGSDATRGGVSRGPSFVLPRRRGRGAAPRH